MEVDEAGFGEEQVVDCLLAEAGFLCLLGLVVDFDLDFAHDFLGVVAEEGDDFGLEGVVFEDQLIGVQVAFEEQFVRWLMGREVQQLELEGDLIEISLDIIFDGDFVLAEQVDRIAVFIFGKFDLF